MGKKSQYTQEFRDEAVRLSLRDGKSVAETARSLGINEQTLHSWRRQAREDPERHPEYRESLEEENERLRRRRRQRRGSVTSLIQFFP